MKINLIKNAVLISFLVFGYCLPAAAPSQLSTYDYLLRVIKLAKADPNAAKKAIDELDTTAGENAGYNFRQILKALEAELKKEAPERTVQARPSASAASMAPQVFASMGAGAGALEPSREFVVTRGVVMKNAFGQTLDIQDVRKIKSHLATASAQLETGDGQFQNKQFFKNQIQQLIDIITNYGDLKERLANNRNYQTFIDTWPGSNGDLNRDLNDEQRKSLIDSASVLANDIIAILEGSQSRSI